MRRYRMTSAVVLVLIVASACAAHPAAPQFTPEHEAAVSATFTQTVRVSIP